VEWCGQFSGFAFGQEALDAIMYYNAKRYAPWLIRERPKPILEDLADLFGWTIDQVAGFVEAFLELAIEDIEATIQFAILAATKPGAALKVLAEAFPELGPQMLETIRTAFASKKNFIEAVALVIGIVGGIAALRKLLGAFRKSRFFRPTKASRPDIPDRPRAHGGAPESPDGTHSTGRGRGESPEGTRGHGDAEGPGGGDGGKRSGGSQPSFRSFKSGDLFERRIQTARGPVDVVAEVEIRGNRLILKDLSVYREGGAAIGESFAELHSATRSLAREAASSGFKTLEVQFTRVPGSSSVAKGSRKITINLDKYR
jgi:hypothetical protein